MAGNLCTLKASHRDGRAGTWVWSLVDDGHDGRGQFEPAQAEGISYRAPQVAVPTTVHIQVIDNADPSSPTVLPIQVLPRIEGLAPEDQALLFQTLLPSVLGPDWMAPIPSATLFAGHLEEPTVDQPKPMEGISSICYVEEDPALGRHWLVGDAAGIKRVSSVGACTALPGVAGRGRRGACHGRRGVRPQCRE